MDLAAAALQFVSIAAQSFQGCMQAFEFFETAQHIGADGDLFRTGLEVQKYRLIRWANQVGLGAKARQTLNWQVAGLVMEQLLVFLTSAEKLKTRYSLEISEEMVVSAEKLRAEELPKQGIAKLIARLRPNIYTTAGKIIQDNNSTMKRLRWASLDKSKLKQFLGEIKDLIDNLELLLEHAERDSEKEDFGRLLRGLVSLTTTTSEAGEIGELIGEGSHQDSRSEKAIKAATFVKQVRLVLGADKREDERQDEIAPSAKEPLDFMPKLRKFNKKRVRPRDDGKLRYVGIEFALYEDLPIIIQWKTAEGAEWEKYEDQMKFLAVLLMSLSHESFRSLQCLGCLAAKDIGRHGLVFAAPDSSFDWEMKSLGDLISDIPSVSLVRRLQFANDLAESLIQLHTAGWMHKSLRPDNVVFLAKRGSGDEGLLASKLFIVGYEYARPDTQDAAAFTQLPDTELKADLYRHPQARGANRETYQKRFDMYALACIMVELMSWTSLAELHSRYGKQDLKAELEHAEKTNGVIEVPSLDVLLEEKEAVEFLKHQAGEKMLKAIMACLEMKKVEGTDEALLEEEMSVVDQLLSCRI